MRTPSFGSDMVELCFWLQRAQWFHGNGFVAAATAMVMPSRKFIRFNLAEREQQFCRNRFVFAATATVMFLRLLKWVVLI